MSETTIGTSFKLKRELIKKKRSKRETYEDVIWRLLK
jgi:hypothetical protein